MDTIEIEYNQNMYVLTWEDLQEYLIFKYSDENTVLGGGAYYEYPYLSLRDGDEDNVFFEFESSQYMTWDDCMYELGQRIDEFAESLANAGIYNISGMIGHEIRNNHP